VQSRSGPGYTQEIAQDVLSRDYDSAVVGSFLGSLNEVGFLTSADADALKCLAASTEAESKHSFQDQYQQVIDGFTEYHSDLNTFHKTMKAAVGQAKLMEVVANQTLNTYLSGTDIDDDPAQEQHDTILESLQQLGPLLDIHKYRCLPRFGWITTFDGIKHVADESAASAAAGGVMEDIRSATTVALSSRHGAVTAITLDPHSLMSRISQRHGLGDEGISLLSMATSLPVEEYLQRSKPEKAALIDMRKAHNAWADLKDGSVPGLVSRCASMGDKIPLTSAGQRTGEERSVEL
jgi:hypothetical protein